MEWYVIAVLVVIVLFLAANAHGAVKKIDDLGLDLIDRVRISWKDTKCEEWPERNGEYKCTGTFYVHAQGINAKKSTN